MGFRTWLSEDIQKYFPFMLPKYISPEDAERLHFFGPVYHGTTDEKRELIQHQGFQFYKSPPRSGEVRHGFDPNAFSDNDILPPIHFLGWGSYFTKSLGIAKNFNVGTGKGLKAYYIGGADNTPPRIEEINFGSNNTMMKWWKKYGYDMPYKSEFRNQAELEARWMQETERLTNNLKAEFDAVHFRGKSMRGSLLDGNQICVYRPEECVYTIDPTKSPGYVTENNITLRPGDRVQIQGTKATAYMVKVNDTRKDDPWQWAYPSKFQVMVGNLKGMDEIIKVHGPTLRKAIEMAEKKNKAIMVTRRQNMTPEESVQRWYDYNTMKSTFEYKVPSVLIAKVLKQGERVK